MWKIGAGLAAALLLAVIPATAQQPAPAGAEPAAPRVEVFGGYSLVHARAVPAGGCCINLHGGGASVAVNVNEWIGVVGDVSGQHTGDVLDSGESLRVITVAFGPRLSLRRERFTLFAHELFGVGHAGGTLYTENFQEGSEPPSARTAFVMIFGGGLDVHLSRHFAIRAVQADWYFTSFPNGVNDRQDNLRVTSGIVIRFGR